MTARQSKGFTLIELMIVVVVIALLSAIAYPSYTDHIRKTKRAEARTRLLQISQLQERNFTENNTYTLAIDALLGVAGTVYSSENNSDDSGYQITAAAGGTGVIATSYILTATRQPSMIGDTVCGDLKLHNTGKKEITGSGTVAKCWN